MQENTKKTLSPTMTASQVKAFLHKHLDFKTYADDVFHNPAGPIWVLRICDDLNPTPIINWDVLDALIDKEFDSP